MTVRFSAPSPALQTIIHLPNPAFGDSEGQALTVIFKRSVNNSRYSYIEANETRRKLQFQFEMTQAKGFELIEFIRKYLRVKVEYFDELGQTWIGFFTTNPNETETRPVSIGNANAMFAGVSIQVEFEGTLQP